MLLILPDCDLAGSKLLHSYFISVLHCGRIRLRTVIYRFPQLANVEKTLLVPQSLEKKRAVAIVGAKISMLPRHIYLYFES